MRRLARHHTKLTYSSISTLLGAKGKKKKKKTGCTGGTPDLVLLLFSRRTSQYPRAQAEANQNPRSRSTNRTSRYLIRVRDLVFPRPDERFDRSFRFIVYFQAFIDGNGIPGKVRMGSTADVPFSIRMWKETEWVAVNCRMRNLKLR